MDFTNKVLVSTISLPVAARSCAYDYEKDAFWVNVWSTDLILYDRQGQELNRITAPESLYGSEFDNNTKISGYDGPFLWVFTGTSTGVDGIIKAYDIATKTLTTVTHNVAQELGAGIAGGLFTTTEYEGGTLTLGGICQGTTNDYLFGYELSITNLPPYTPGAPSGPEKGVTGIEYEFTATTTDPEGDPIEYWFDFGDGQNSGWVSPGSAKHIWTTAGTFEVTVKARDAVHGGESAFSPPHEIEILGGPVLEIKKVKGGLFKVTAEIENNGGTNATGVEWTISLAGGAILGKESNGTVDIPVGEKAIIQSRLIFGFGKTVVTVTATCPESSDSVTRNGIVILFFTYVRTGGG